MSSFEVNEPILNPPFTEPAEHWRLVEGEAPQRVPGRREAGYFYRDPVAPFGDDEHAARGVWEPLPLVNLIRERIKAWGIPGTPYLFLACLFLPARLPRPE
jgi:type III restriction enzyme